MKSFTFRNINDEKDLKSLLNFMQTQPQLYPNYEEWLFGKCQKRIEEGIYVPIVALADNLIIGDAVYRFTDEHNIEIKNFRIDKNYQERDLGHFLLKQIESETKVPSFHLDVSINNFSGVQFFIRNGFNITKSENLYSENLEYLMTKELK